MINVDIRPPLSADAQEKHLFLLHKYGKFLLRGTNEWENREDDRIAMGCKCVSRGPVPRDRR